jgi:hypothetical protein
VLSYDPQVFENLEWEIECTADVWKALRDKHVLPELKQRIVQKIQHLAAGEWTRHLCKKEIISAEAYQKLTICISF